MAVRGWGGPIAAAIGVAAGAGAAQLGLGYGLGIIAWMPTGDGAGEAVWVASLAWATWISATSVVAGAVVADRWSGGAGASTAEETGDRVAPLAAALWRLALAVAAAVGALVTVALVAVPARAAERADTFSPQTIAAGYAVIGVVVGLLVAVGAIAFRAVAANVIVTVSWLWLLAIVAVIDNVASGRGLTNAQLGVWQLTDNSEGYWFRNMYLPGVALSLGSALIIGALAGYPAARRRENRVGLAISGAIGPLLVAAAYFLAAPRLVGVRAEQLSAYLVAPYAVIAGIAGSVLISAISPPTRSGPDGESSTAADGRDQSTGARTEDADTASERPFPGGADPIGPEAQGRDAHGREAHGRDATAAPDGISAAAPVSARGHASVPGQRPAPADADIPGDRPGEPGP